MESTADVIKLFTRIFEKVEEQGREWSQYRIDSAKEMAQLGRLLHDVEEIKTRLESKGEATRIEIQQVRSIAESAKADAGSLKIDVAALKVEVVAATTAITAINSTAAVAKGGFDVASKVGGFVAALLGAGIMAFLNWALTK